MGHRSIFQATRRAKLHNLASIVIHVNANMTVKK